MIPYFSQLKSLYNLENSKVQYYWARAQAFGLPLPQTTRVFTNLISMSESAPDWWARLSAKQKQAYLERHPGSKKARQEKAKELAVEEPEVGKPEVYEETPEVVPEEPTAAEAPSDEDSEVSKPEEVPEWWDRLSDEEQKEYLEQHPDSSLVPNNHDPERDAPKWWLRLSEDEQRIYLEQHPDSKLEITPDKQVSIKSAAKDAWTKHRAKAASTLSHHKKGLWALKELFTGGSLNREQRSQARDTAILGTKLVLGALAGLALFTIGPAAIAIAAKLFLDDQGVPDLSESSEVSGDAAEILDRISDWLLNQDPKDLEARIKLEEEKNAQ